MKKSLIFPLFLLALATSSLAQSPPEESIQSIIKPMVEGLSRIEPIAADVVRTQHRQLQDRKAQLTAQQYQQGEVRWRWRWCRCIRPFITRKSGWAVIWWPWTSWALSKITSSNANSSSSIPGAG